MGFTAAATERETRVLPPLVANCDAPLTGAMIFWFLRLCPLQPPPWEPPPPPPPRATAVHVGAASLAIPSLSPFFISSLRFTSRPVAAHTATRSPTHGSNPSAFLFLLQHSRPHCPCTPLSNFRPQP
ncbi:hypothetical protein RIF29_14464 [Crotalaria pallida]|uniref:Uncharacterized protein n=1 Tax=Crotalaria pallida TaxID=3830 RepID=A0AAN9IDS7_CROPI